MEALLKLEAPSREQLLQVYRWAWTIWCDHRKQYDFRVACLELAERAYEHADDPRDVDAVEAYRFAANSLILFHL